MLLNKRSIVLISFTAYLLSLLTSCANSPTGKALQDSLAADPKLKNSETVFSNSQQSNSQNQESAKLPEDFPTEIPRYPDAQLQTVESLLVPNTQGQRTTWSSSDSSTKILDFYRRQFELGSWERISQPNEETGGTFVVRQNDLQVTISIPAPTISSTETPSPLPTATDTNPNITQFEIQYIRNSVETAESSNQQQDTTQPVSSERSQNFSDLDQVSQPFRQQIEDLAALGVLTLNPSSTKTNSDTTQTQFEPNKMITRQDYARWLVSANNLIYANNPGKQIRLASDASQPAFTDVPRTHPEFQSIQALAEAGLIPSSLTGDTTAIQFRPDAPLTRENLISWKVPLDTRQALPSASIDAVKQTWGFQDVSKIDPKALRAILADFQNGEQANIRRVFGYTTLFQPKKPVTRAEAAAALWYFGSQGEGLSAQDALSSKSQTTPSISESAPSAPNSPEL
ncbi:MAG TPA: S-layer protein [Cyanobacteria bacterium UBA11162]|nr:S-layer protein [Cyanobacteria bacterium UBA11162]